MNPTVYKYPLISNAPSGVISIPLPSDAKLLHVGEDPQRALCVWAEVTPMSPLQLAVFTIIGTGHPLPVDCPRYLSTIVQGSFVWHVYTDWVNY